jgi:membrane protease YdiL (CAAX protease family)
VKSRYPLVLTLLAGLAIALLHPYSSDLRSQLPGYQQQSVGAELMSVALDMCLLYGVIRLALRLGPGVGLGWPPLEGWGEDSFDLGPARRAVLTAALLGAAVAICLGVFSELTPDMFPMRELRLPGWRSSAMASIGAGVYEELWFRLGAMTVFASLSARLERGGPAGAEAIWAGNLLAAILFGAAHLPLADALGTLTRPVIAMVIGGNAIVGLACGWLYWRKGLLAAMVAHATVDLVLKVALPLLQWGP